MAKCFISAENKYQTQFPVLTEIGPFVYYTYVNYYYNSILPLAYVLVEIQYLILYHGYISFPIQNDVH